MDKIQLRKQIKARIAELTERQRAQQSKLACQNLINIPQFKNASVIMVFLSLPHEVDTTTIILQAWQQGKTVAVPKISWQQRHMLPIQINSLDSGISIEKFGLRNPTTGLPMPIEDINLVITPALAFDRQGNRLGRGGAYFDRFFASKQLNARKCGLVFSQQIVDSIPMEAHDKTVDLIVTDQGVIDCNSK